MLNSCVVSSLEKAFEPSLKSCKIIWNDKEEQLDEVFRNQMIYRTAIIPKDKLETLQFGFFCQEDPATREPIERYYNKENFVSAE